jgi:hypothetical protein
MPNAAEQVEGTRLSAILKRLLAFEDAWNLRTQGFRERGYLIRYLFAIVRC